MRERVFYFIDLKYLFALKNRNTTVVSSSYVRNVYVENNNLFKLNWRIREDPFENTNDCAWSRRFCIPYRYFVKHHKQGRMVKFQHSIWNRCRVIGFQSWKPNLYYEEFVYLTMHLSRHRIMLESLVKCHLKDISELFLNFWSKI